MNTRAIETARSRNEFVKAGGALPRAVQRIIEEFRRGVPVVIHSREGARYIALAAVIATDDTLREFLTVAIDAPVLLVAHPLGREAMTSVALPGTPRCIRAATLRAVATANLPSDTLSDVADDLAFQRVAQQASKISRLADMQPALLMARANDQCSGLMSISDAALRACPTSVRGSMTRLLETRLPVDVAADARLVVFRPDDGAAECVAVLFGSPETAAQPLVCIAAPYGLEDLFGGRYSRGSSKLHSWFHQLSLDGDAVILIWLPSTSSLTGLLRAQAADIGGGPRVARVDASSPSDSDACNLFAAAAILRGLGIHRVQLFTDFPTTAQGLRINGIEVTGTVSPGHRSP